MVEQIEDILGSNAELHVEILSTVVRKAYRCPIKRKFLHQRNILVQDCKHPKEGICTPSAKSVSKTFRKIALLRSQKKNQDAQRLSDHLKSECSSVKELAAITNENERTIYRLLSPPKKRTQIEYVRKLKEQHKKEVINMYLCDEITYSLPDIKYAGLRVMTMTVKEAYEKHYLLHSTMERKMSLASFSYMKPDNVRTVKQTPMRGVQV